MSTSPDIGILPDAATCQACGSKAVGSIRYWGDQQPRGFCDKHDPYRYPFTSVSGQAPIYKRWGIV